MTSVGGFDWNDKAVCHPLLCHRDQQCWLSFLLSWGESSPALARFRRSAQKHWKQKESRSQCWSSSLTLNKSAVEEMQPLRCSCEKIALSLETDGKFWTKNPNQTHKALSLNYPEAFDRGTQPSSWPPRETPNSNLPCCRLVFLIDECSVPIKR